MLEKDMNIGNYIRFKCFDGGEIIVKVTGYNEGVVYGVSEQRTHWCPTGNVEPIPITKEILEKNGFKECDSNQWSYYKYEDDDSTKRSLYHILWSADEPYLAIASYTEGFGEFYRIGIKYVHELQNALSICNIELNFVI